MAALLQRIQNLKDIWAELKTWIEEELESVTDYEAIDLARDILTKMKSLEARLEALEGSE